MGKTFYLTSNINQIRKTYFFTVSLIQMNKTPAKPTVKTPSPANNIETDADDDDIFDGGEYPLIVDGLSEETIKRDARRKIEIYWEKKRLREQFEDFDEAEFGF